MTAYKLADVVAVLGAMAALACGLTHDTDGLSKDYGLDDAATSSGGIAGDAGTGGGGSGGIAGDGGAGGEGATGGASGTGGTTPCGNPGDACCSSGVACFLANNVCRDGSCVECGGQAEPCCIIPKCESAALVCDPADQCVPCGGVGQRCCDTSDACPNEPHCCGDQSDPDKCFTCTMPACTCKVCCARCQGGSAQKLVVNAGQTCLEKANSVCGGAANVVFSDWQTSCP
jgi:hypothetical protein